MASYDDGKQEIVTWVKQNYPAGSTCLDVGACDGKWSDLLEDYLIMDAVEIFRPYVEENGLFRKYRGVLIGDVIDYRYNWYDLVIFGDVIEHMQVRDAQKVLMYAARHCRDLVVGVPFKYRQGAINGNPFEEHIQDDLTPELMSERYPMLVEMFMARNDYAYYHKA